jgi:hypothetical protein
MNFPWTVLLETPEGHVEAQNVMAASDPKEVITQAKDDFNGWRVLGVMKGSHANIVYGHQVGASVVHKNQMRIPFKEGGHNH